MGDRRGDPGSPSLAAPLPWIIMTTDHTEHEPSLRYRVAMPNPSDHSFHVWLDFAPSGNEEVRLVFPVWTPGSYLIREYPRHLTAFKALDESGRELEWGKKEKNIWTLRPDGADRITVSYRLYANELSVRTNHLNSDHGYFNGTATFLYPEHLRDRSVTLEIEAPSGWRAFTGLDPIAGSDRVFGAPSYDRLADSPVEIGDHDFLDFEIEGIHHRFVLAGEGFVDKERLERDLIKVVEESLRLFGSLPYRHYTFICHFTNQGGGGLEHENSCTIQTGRDVLRDEKKYGKFLELIAHEHFHAWNVKRIRPAAFDRFDYSRESYTTLLWVFEGITSYYDELLLVRAGLRKPEDYLSDLAKKLTNRSRTPGRHVMSLAEASFDAWIKYYRQDENAANSQISYYAEGSLAAFVLDLEIRRRTEGGRSLDDVMRHMNSTLGSGSGGLEEDGLSEVIDRATGLDLSQLLRQLIHEVSEPDFARALAWVGVELGRKSPETRRFAGTKIEKGYLGVTTRSTEGRLRLDRVLLGTPAADAGLESGDEIVAFDGRRVTPGTFQDRVAERVPGSEVTITLFRHDVQREVAARIGTNPFPAFELKPSADPGDDARSRFKQWTGQDLPVRAVETDRS